MSFHLSMARRSFLLGAAASLAGGCGSADVWPEGQRLTSAILGGADLPAGLAEQVGYAEMGVRLGSGAQTLVVAMSVDDGIEWVEPIQPIFRALAFDVRRGRLMKSVGLPVNLSATRLQGEDPIVARSLRAGRPALARRTIDLLPSHWSGVVVESRFSPDGEERLEILGRSIETEIWREDCVARELDWRFANRFWLERGAGFVWKSRQFVAPEIDDLEFTVFRPAATEV